jgi:O-antigen/teichoic acid export membrane protein
MSSGSRTGRPGDGDRATLARPAGLPHTDAVSESRNALRQPPAGSPPAGHVRGATTLFGDIGALFAARVLTIVLTVAAVVVTTRILDPTHYGTFAYVTIVATIIFTVGSAWTAPAVSRFGRERLDERGEMTAVTWERFLVTAPAVVAVALGVVAFAVAGAVPRAFTWPLIVVAIAYGASLVMSDHVVYTLQALGRMRLASVGTVARQAAILAALGLVLAVAPQESVFAVATTRLGGSLLLTIAFVPFAWRGALWPPATDPKLRRRLLRFSVPLLAFTLSQYVIQTIDLPLIGVFRTPSDVGLYALAYQAYTVLQQLAAVSVVVLTPLFVSLRVAGREDVVRLFAERAVWQVTFVASTLAGAAATIVPLVVPFLFGARFSGASDPLVVLLGANLLLLVANLLAPVLLLHEASAAVGVTNVIAAAVNIVLDLLFLGLLGFGIWSPAAATAISVVVIVAGYARAAQRRTGAVVAIHPATLLPVAVGIAAALVFGQLAAVAVGIPVVLIIATVVLARGGLFDPGDADLVNRLNMPRPVRRLIEAGIAFGSRS